MCLSTYSNVQKPSNVKQSRGVTSQAFMISGSEADCLEDSSGSIVIGALS